MAIFAVIALPVCLLGVVAGLFRESLSWKRLLVPFGAGMLGFLPAYLVYRILDGLVPDRYEPGYLYLDALISEVLVLPLLGLLLYGLFFGWPRDGVQTADRFVEAYGFLSGLFSLVMVAEVVRNASYLSAYLLFLEPLLYIAVSALLPLLVLSALDTYGYRVVLFVAGAVVLPGILATVGFLFRLNHPVAAAAIAAGAFAASVASVVVFRLRT